MAEIDRGKFGVPLHGTGGKIRNSDSWTFFPRTHRIYTPSVIDVGPVVSEL